VHVCGYVAQSCSCGVTSSHSRARHRRRRQPQSDAAHHAPQTPSALPLLRTLHARCCVRSRHWRTPAAASPSFRRCDRQHSGGVSSPPACNLALCPRTASRPLPRHIPSGRYVSLPRPPRPARTNGTVHAHTQPIDTLQPTDATTASRTSEHAARGCRVTFLHDGVARLLDWHGAWGHKRGAARSKDGGDNVHVRVRGTVMRLRGHTLTPARAAPMAQTAASGATKPTLQPQHPPVLPLLRTLQAPCRLRSGHCRGPAAPLPSCRHFLRQYGGGLSGPSAHTVAALWAPHRISHLPATSASPGRHGPRERTE